MTSTPEESGFDPDAGEPGSEPYPDGPQDDDEPAPPEGGTA